MVRLHYSFYSDSTYFEIIVHTSQSKMAQDWFEKFENIGSMFKNQKYFVCTCVEFWMEGNFWSIAIGPYCEKMHQFLFLNHISRKVAWFFEPLPPSQNTQSCNRRPFYSTFTFEKKTVLFKKKSIFYILFFKIYYESF